MASIEKRKRKNGPVYLITVSNGVDYRGNRIKHNMTWNPPEGMTEKKADREAQKVAMKFEEQIQNGYAADNRVSFAEYAEYVLELKERAGTKYKTLESYRYLLKRINPAIGHLKLADIRPAHLNRFYANLSESGLRDGAVKGKAVDKTQIKEMLKKKGVTHDTIAEKAGLSTATVDAICSGNSVTEESINKFCDALTIKPEKNFLKIHDTRPLSNKSILEHHRFIHTVLSQAEKEMIVQYNAADKATPPKADRHDPNYFQPNQIIDILNALDKEPIKWRTILNLLIVTGCRRGEIAALKWKNVDTTNCKLRIDATLLYSAEKGVFENSTKTGDIRFLKIPSETMTLLEEYKKDIKNRQTALGNVWDDEGYCFLQDNGKPMNPDSITSYCGDFSRRYKLPHINPHAFRHTVASTLINNGQDVVTVAKRLGHSRTSTTIDIYSHIMAEADADASECIADVLLRKNG